MTGAGIHSLKTPEVRINPANRHSTLVTWEDHKPSIFSKVARPVQPEGLGIDHEAWKKSKGA